jgi:hypothetical protein
MAVPSSEATLTLPREPYFFPSPWPSARALTRSPWKVALIASSSWSHSFLTEKHGRMYPDVESDRRYFEALRAAIGTRGAIPIWRRPKIAVIMNC